MKDVIHFGHNLVFLIVTIIVTIKNVFIFAKV